MNGETRLGDQLRTVKDREFGWGGIKAKYKRICHSVFSVQLVMADRVKWYKDSLLLQFQGESFAKRSSSVFPDLLQRWQKSYHRDNWLVAVERSQRRCFLILRCRLFLSLRCRRFIVQDCLPTQRERELGLDRRETGQFYPTVTRSRQWYGPSVREEPWPRTTGKSGWPKGHCPEAAMRGITAERL